MAAKFRALLRAYVFDLAVGHDRLVEPGTIVESSLDLDADSVASTGEAPSSTHTRAFERLPADADLVRNERNCWIARPTFRAGEEAEGS